MNVKIIWSNFLSSIKNEMTPLSFNTWFKDTELYEYKNGLAKIIVPMGMFKRHLATKYYDLIVNTLSDIIGDNVDIQFFLPEELEEEKNQISFMNFDNQVGESTQKIERIHKSNLNPNYTFESFIVGNSNKFAQAAALDVAENPGNIYNPLFIYGNSGLGKTHLMHAIGNYIEQHSNKKVLYVSSDQFINDFLGINKKDENGKNFDYVSYFKDKYRNIDVLIIDDIQFFQGATQTQNEFFHTFTSLYNDNKQIIISSDRSPDDLKLLEDRLRTRFCWGLTADIYPPDFDLRVAIIKKKIIGESINKNIPDDVIEYIASNVGNDVRHLEGSITRLLAYSTIMGGADITLDLAIEVLKDYVNKGYSEKNNVNRIQRIVAEHFQISVDDMKSKKRSANLAFPRQVAMYLCRKLTEESFPKIGIEFGGKDHSTVMHSVEKIEKEMKTNQELANIIEKLKKEIV
ncbi:MAG: chromosomal replication initiator protein DnaA [bacterium]|nr:chromosomal replication initiator protein DnaA [bacterium]